MGVPVAVTSAVPVASRSTNVAVALSPAKVSTTTDALRGATLNQSSVSPGPTHSATVAPLARPCALARLVPATALAGVPTPGKPMEAASAYVAVFAWAETAIV